MCDTEPYSDRIWRLLVTVDKHTLLLEVFIL
jgi:hypothetical protein